MAVPRPTRSPARPAAVLAVLPLLAAAVSLAALSGTAHAQARTCADFTSWEAAQAAFDADRVGLAGLDSNGNGEACEDLRDDDATTAAGTETTTSVTPSTPPPSDPVNALIAGAVIDEGSTTWTTSTTSSSGSGGDSDDSGSDDSGSDDSDSDSGSNGTDDKDCPDFASQADAQAALDDEPGDPDNLDADDDGIACEDHFGDDGQQVQVHPTGGVDTGGTPADA